MMDADSTPPSLSGLHPAQLFHVGVVADDIDAAMREMSQNLGVEWVGGKATEMDLVVFGAKRRIEMRIAHAVQGPPHIELIQAVPGTPWSAPHAPGVHHLCYWSDHSAEVCQQLEQTGNRRILGEAGANSGYFLTPAGMVIEVIPRQLRDYLSAWITKPRDR